jgi:hypothetical protein
MEAFVCRLNHTATLADGALSWVDEHLDFFTADVGAVSKQQALRQKALVELALLCILADRNEHWRNDPRIARFLDHIYHAWDSALGLACTVRVYSAFVPNLLLAATLWRTKRLDDRILNDLRRHVVSSNVLFGERTPHRVLEVKHTLELCGFQDPLPPYESITPTTILGRPFNIIYVTDDQAYSVTHAIYYLTDFGGRPLVGLTASSLKSLQVRVAYLLGMYIHRRNWDLVGELLIACLCLPFPLTRVHEVAVAALLGAQWADGMVPGPFYKPRATGDVASSKSSEDLMADCYHTTLVAALTGVLFPDAVFPESCGSTAMTGMGPLLPRLK